MVVYYGLFHHVFAMNLRSDNEAPAHPLIMEAITQANQDSAHAYGDDAISQQLDDQFGDWFDHEVSVFPIISGTAANALSLAQCCPPYGAVLCHQESHIHQDECGAPEFFTGGAKLIPIDGKNGKLHPTELAQTLEMFGFKGDHEPQISAISITQASEAGTVYSAEQVGEIGAFAKSRNLHLHMDGARFANALAATGATPASLTWQAGVDILSFGATKNGTLSAEAIVVFKKSLTPGLRKRRMKGGHLLSKMRYISAQLQTYIADDNAIAWASNANQKASIMAEAIEAHPECRLAYPAQANEIFAILPESLAESLRTAGFQFHRWPYQADMYRFVVPWNCSSEAANRFAACCAPQTD